MTFGIVIGTGGLLLLGAGIFLALARETRFNAHRQKGMVMMLLGTLLTIAGEAIVLMEITERSILYLY